MIIPMVDTTIVHTQLLWAFDVKKGL